MLSLTDSLITGRKNTMRGRVREGGSDYLTGKLEGDRTVRGWRGLTEREVAG